MKQRKGVSTQADHVNGSADLAPAGPKQAWSETHGLGQRTGIFARQFIADLGTLLVMGLSPIIAIMVYVINSQYNGSVAQLGQYLMDRGFKGLVELYPGTSREAWTYIAAFGVLQSILMRLAPGKWFDGPVTPKENKPLYKDNGVVCYLFTLALFFSSWHMGWFNPGRVYDQMGHILSCLNLFSLLFCLGLYVKGRVAPSSTDSGSTGSLLYDYYWGMELHPRLGRYFDLKQWTNCRMGMMGWAVLILCYAVKQYQDMGTLSDSMAVSVLLMQVYIFKFFVWESGYLYSMDIQHDRAGYYICWGCLVWVPSVYTSPAMYLVNHPVQLGHPMALAITLAGLISIYINYDIDRQRQVFRAKQGNLKIWGQAPRIIHAKYLTGSGEERSSLLLASGWWGMARHLQYLPEILGAFFWTVPGGFHHLLPYFYVIFLTFLLLDRTTRDDAKCRAKYGVYWEKYCSLVPYKMIPGIF